jgi:hypothetical protein
MDDNAVFRPQARLRIPPSCLPTIRSDHFPRWARKGHELFYRNGDRMMAVDSHLVALWRQIAQGVTNSKEDDLLVARTAQSTIVACHGLPKPAEYPEVEELLDRHKQSRIALDPGIFAGCFPKPSATNKFLQRVAAEDANGEVWSSQFDVLAKMTKIARLLERLSAGKRQVFDSLAGKNPLGDFFHTLIAVTIEGMARWVKAAATVQITSLAPYDGSLTRAIDRATGQH